MNLLHHYVNGNTDVSIYDDGTKIRQYDDDPKPVHPESMDIKISNKCDGNCHWCHEMSHINGEHADLNRLLEVLKGLPAGVEIAVGGGNALSHPDLFPFLYELKSRGLIPNMTINQKHFGPYCQDIEKLITEKLIYGLGISYSGSAYQNDIAPFIKMTNNIVFHTIMGLNSVTVIDELMEFVERNGGTKTKILILGYKDYGFGSKHLVANNEAITENKLQWYRRLATYFNKNNLVLSFDNLAIEQLKLQRFFTDKAWNKFFMGSEGSYTQYIDAVKQQYAICSVDPNRVSFNDISLFEFFSKIKR